MTVLRTILLSWKFRTKIQSYLFLIKKSEEIRNVYIEINCENCCIKCDQASVYENVSKVADSFYVYCFIDFSG